MKRLNTLSHRHRCSTSTVSWFTVCAIIIVTVLAPPASAQDIYTKSNLPAPGTSYRLQHAEAATVNVQPGGINAVWDYSTLKPIKGIVDSISVVDAKSLSGDVPPEADVAIINSTNGRHEYYATLKPSLRSLGYEDNDVKALMGASPYDIEPIPVKYNVVYANTVEGAIELKSNPELRIRRDGTIRFAPDGNGTLRLPGALPAQRSIRIRWEEEYVDTVFRNDIPLYTAATRTFRWVWMAENSCTEYLVIETGSVKFQRITEDPPKDSLIASVRYYTSGDVTDVADDDETALQVMPNPATDVVRITSAELLDANVEIALCTQLGEELYRRSQHCVGTSIIIPLPSQVCASQTLLLHLRINGKERSRMVTVVR